VPTSTPERADANAPYDRPRGALKIRRVVTGHDGRGEALFVSDEESSR
jgi:hypothetical protein